MLLVSRIFRQRIDPAVTVVGQFNVHPQAPLKINEEGEVSGENGEALGAPVG